MFGHCVSTLFYVLATSCWYLHVNNVGFLLQTVDAKYAEVAASVGPDQEVMFEEEQITLDIPKKGLVLENGWTITPHTYPAVSFCAYAIIY